EREIGVLRLCLRPCREGADDIVAEHHHEMIAFRKNHQARWRPDPPDDIQHGIGVPRECPNAGLLAADEGPDEWLQRVWSRLSFRGASCPRAEQGDRAEPMPHPCRILPSYRSEIRLPQMVLLKEGRGERRNKKPV